MVLLCAAAVGCASTDDKSDADNAANVAADGAEDGSASEPAEPEPPPPAPEGKVAFDTGGLSIAPSGAMSRGAAARIALENAGKLNDCYREGLRADPALTLELDLKVTVDTEGRGKLVGVEGATLPGDLQTCFEREVSVLPFEWPSEDVEITYPVTFMPAA